MCGPLCEAVLRHAAAWCQDNGLPEEALDYFMSAGDIEPAAVLVEKFWLPVQRQGRVATIQRWLGWLRGCLSLAVSCWTDMEMVVLRGSS